MGNTNSNPPGPIIVNGQSRTGRTGRFIFSTLSLAGAQLCHPLLPAWIRWENLQEKNYFPEPNRALFVDFSLSKFNVKCHILSTGGGCSYFSIGSKSFQYWQDFPPLSMVTLLLGFSAFCTLGLEKCISKFRQVGEFHAAVSTIVYSTLSPYIQIVKVVLEDNPSGWTYKWFRTDEKWGT